jgi:hypothetical protein
MSMELGISEGSEAACSGNGNHKRVVFLPHIVEDLKHKIIVRDRRSDESKFIRDMLHALKKFCAGA